MLEIEKRFIESIEKLDQKMEIFANKIQNIEMTKNENINSDLEAESIQKRYETKNKKQEVNLSLN
jgi:hypothetical protein